MIIKVTMVSKKLKMISIPLNQVKYPVLKAQNITNQCLKNKRFIRSASSSIIVPIQMYSQNMTPFSLKL